MTRLLPADHVTKHPALFGGAIGERDSDLYTSLCWAALPIVVLWPDSLFGLGFQLPLAATLPIAALHDRLVCLCPSI